MAQIKRGKPRKKTTVAPQPQISRAAPATPARQQLSQRCIALQAEGDLAGLERELETYLNSHPGEPGLIHDLGVIRLHLGKYAAALPCLEETCRTFPHNIDAWNQRAIALNGLGRFKEAHQSNLHAISLCQQDNPELISNLGKNLVDDGQYLEAVRWLEPQLANAPHSVGLRQNLANAYTGVNRLGEAKALLHHMIVEQQANAEVLHNYSLLLQAENRQEEALHYLQQALERKPDYADALVSLGKTLTDTGRFDEAESWLRRALTQQPGKPDAWAALAALRKMTLDDLPWLEQAEAILRANPPHRHEIMLRFAMGKFCDDVQRYDEAFLHYRRANELKKTITPVFDHALHSALIGQLIHAYPARAITTEYPGANPSARPLFIVGMPRSGTSLIEQILASHPAIHGGGELSFWNSEVEQHREQVMQGRIDEMQLG